MSAGRWRARLFARWNAGFARALRALDALHQGLWLGWLDADDLNVATGRWYRSPRRRPTPEYLRVGLWDWEAATVARHFAGCRRLLVAGAGAGREVLAS